MADEPSRKRAAAILDIPADADANSARSAFLKGLAQCDFAPPEAWNAAAIRLGVELSRTPYASQVLAEFEMADVEEFLAIYWTLPPADRSRRWLELEGRFQHAESRAALHGVKEGLGIAVADGSNQAMMQLSSFLRALYLLPSRERAIQRIKWQMTLEKPSDARAIVKRFCFEVEPMAKLAPVLLRMRSSQYLAMLRAEAIRWNTEDTWERKPDRELSRGSLLNWIVFVIACTIAVTVVIGQIDWTRVWPSGDRRATPQLLAPIGNSRLPDANIEFSPTPPTR